MKFDRTELQTKKLKVGHSQRKQRGAKIWDPRKYMRNVDLKSSQLNILYYMETKLEKEKEKKSDLKSKVRIWILCQCM